MQPSFSYPDVIDPETPTITRVFRRCQSSPGLIIFQDSPPEYTSLKDIIQVSSNSPPPPFWKRFRRKPQPCRCWNGEVLIKKITNYNNNNNKKKKVIPVLDDNEESSASLLTGTGTGTASSASLWYPSPRPVRTDKIINSEESEALLLCPNPKGLCMKRNRKKIHSEKCISCTYVILKKVFKEVRNVFYKLMARFPGCGHGRMHRT